MTLREIKKKYKLPSRWNKSEVLCYFIGLKKGALEIQSVYKVIELNLEFKSIMTSNDIIKNLKKK